MSSPNNIDVEQVVIDGVSPSPSANIHEDGHEIAISPDGTKYYITCQATNNIRVFDITNDALIATIPVGVYPQEICLSTTTPYGYVSCMEDTATYPGKRGSVYAFNWQTNTVIGSIYTGHQPHAVIIDEDKQEVMVTNRNVSPGGPAPHHSSACAGRNGSVKFIDMQSFTLVPKKGFEVSVDPYGGMIRP